MAQTYLPYEEPRIRTILVQSTFIFLLNVVNSALDKLVYCGLIGQILLGVAWGVPGSKWLSESVQSALGQLGYLGLILIVYEGGLNTSLRDLRANWVLSSCVAITGIGLPIGLSFIMMPLLSATKLQAFAAGAALCSTSLGTTFTVLATSGLVHSRLGVVLTSAAMLDDIVGLIMVQVISNLGVGEVGPITVLRPIIVAVGLAVVLFLTCRFVLKSLSDRTRSWIQLKPDAEARINHHGKHVMIFVQFILLFGLVAGATYAGTSNLFAAYLAGTMVTWLDGLINIPSAGGTEIFDKHYGPAVDFVLKPFFFASVGFSIPISRLFQREIVWKGIVYTILMTVSKLACGIWLLPVPSMPDWLNRPKTISKQCQSRSAQTQSTVVGSEKKNDGAGEPSKQSSSRSEIAANHNDSGSQNTSKQAEGIEPVDKGVESDAPIPNSANASRPRSKVAASVTSMESRRHVRSLYPAAMLGGAMVARGEIGFLISSLAESDRVFSGMVPDDEATTDQPSSIYLVVTWAIMACTIIGPLTIGLLVRRVKRLQVAERERAGGRTDPLGKWGVVQNIQPAADSGAEPLTS